MMQPGVQFCVDAVGVIGPGMPDWRSARDILRGERPYEPASVPRPDAGMLPANERRRAAASVRWALSVAQQAMGESGYSPGEVATIFATSGGDGETLHLICEALAGPGREMSPTRFHNSVHNAAAGYWSIAAGAREPSASLCGYDESFTAGLIEAASLACVERSAVLLVVYDVPYPEPLRAARAVARPFAVALLLAPAPGPRTLVGCRMTLESGAVPCTLPPAALQEAFADNPAGRAIPLLSMIASDRREPVHLGYLDDCRLVVEPVT